ncbi:PilZ domain-containing protein [Aliikangiella marina]|nr:PilZ domain-containing protein [Aliikangiella marina]
MSDQERRHFNRVQFEAEAVFIINEEPVECQVIDLSLHGALVKINHLDPLDKESDFELRIPLSDDPSALISMNLKLTHQDGGSLGLECRHIDLDSITHLRRLVELNLGDSQLLERDFESLSHS